MEKKKRNRPDSDGAFKSAYKKNRKGVIASSDVCALCGLPIDKSLKFPDPYSASVDHIISIKNGGHPSNIENLQLTHLICNQIKGSKATIERNKHISEEQKVIDNSQLPLLMNWEQY